MSQPECILIKVGGSLFDLPDLPSRIRTLIARSNCYRLYLFPGGGATVDVVRAFDRLHGLGEESAHWLALHALTVNAYFLQTLLPELAVAIWPDVGDRAILDPYACAQADEINTDHLPHSWEVTSDSLAARAAHLLGAQELILLKSISLDAGMTWQEAAGAGLVDAYFPTIIKQIPGLRVRVVNGRAFV